MTTYQERQARLLAELAAGSVAVVSRGSDVRWLTGFTGSNGLFVLGRELSLLLTDGRYEEQAAREAAVDSVSIIRGELLEEVPRALDKHSDADPGRVADTVTDPGPASRPGRSTGPVLFQADDLTFERAVRLREMLEEAGQASQPLGDRISGLRETKDAEELTLIRGALMLSEEVMSELPDIIRPGITERELAAEVDYRHRLKGADGPAFETIVAFGARAALPHARPGDARLERGDCILLDFGCVTGGYRSDITRTMVLGRAPEGFDEAYAAVERALAAAQRAVTAGMDGRDLDAVARTSLERDGLAERFSHSLGHGVGLDIHEGPRVSSVTSSRLREGAVITIEPGVYLSGRFGIRIENMVLVEEAGARVLNRLDTGLIVL